MNKKTADLLFAMGSPISPVSSWAKTGAGVVGEFAIRSSFDCLLLAKGQVLRWDKSAGCKSLEVLAGTIWLTETPADGDKLLSVGAVYTVSKRWPFVMEALTPVRLRLEWSSLKRFYWFR